MTISTKTRYGFRLMIYLGTNYETKLPIQLGEIAKKEDISLKYLEKIVQILKLGGCVTVKRGPKGGYRLSKPADQITLLNIFELLEGSSSVLDCIDRDECSRDNECTTISVWKGLSEVIKEYLGKQTLSDVIADNSSINHMFYI